MSTINLVDLIIDKRKPIFITFIALAIISVIAQFFVSVNYNMTDYMPENAPSTEAFEIMEEEYEGSIPNTNVMLYDVSIQEALDYKEQLIEIDGVSDVTWLDDLIDITTPLEVNDQELVDSYYKDGHALLSFAVADGEEVATTDEIYELIGEKNALTGEAIDTATQQKMAFSETMYAAALLIPIIIIILVLSTSSWIEPVFFLTAIGVSVLINMGTNIFIGEVSFVTQSVAPILQLAVSLDYAIFLLHSFERFRAKESTPIVAMRKAIKESFPAIIMSASTTFFGFIALSVMDFEIGADLGFNLVKGITISFISVMVFLPALTLIFYSYIDKTKHRSFLPRVNKVGKAIVKIRIPVLIAVFILIIPSFLGQSETKFIYGIGEQPENTRTGQDLAKIDEVFEGNTQIILLVPRGNVAKEEILIQELQENALIKTVSGYVNTVGTAIPEEYIDESITEQFYSENYSRLIINTSTAEEGDIAFELVEEVKETTSLYYEDTFHALGESVTLYDMKNVVQEDNRNVNILTIVTIAIVLMLAFKSLSFPVVLLLTIQASVWINLSIPYFTNTSLVFIGYLIVSTVQLAATVDYAILLTESYEKNRKEMSAIDAVKKSLDEKFFSIVVSASILTSVGYILWITSTNPIVSSIGLLIGRGALFAFVLVIVFLPALLVIFDKIIEKTSWKVKFFKKEDSE